MTPLRLNLLLVLFTACFFTQSMAQETAKTDEQPKVSAVQLNPFDGIMVLGYVDNGAYLNFTGPNINFTKGRSKFIFGMLPSLRYKVDNAVIKNSPITPNLGFGFTYCYRKAVIQVPFYYDSKTATANGRWNIGIGIGFRLK